MLRVLLLACAARGCASLHIADASNGSAAAAAAGPTCWEADVFGRTDFQLTPTMCRKSIANLGDVDKLGSVAQAMQNRCINVVAIGGSVTCGHATAPNQFADNKADAYPKLLEGWLNKKYPCPAGHNVTNICQAAVDSSHWAEELASWRSEPQHEIWNADMVVVDTVVNDISRRRSSGFRKCVENLEAEESKGIDTVRLAEMFDPNVQYYTELIVRMLQASPRKPAIVYLETAFKGIGEKVAAPPFHIDSSTNHKPVLEYYDVPEVSVINAFTPFHSEKRRKFLHNHYFADRYHPSKFGHKVLAQLLAHALTSAGSQVSGSLGSRQMQHPFFQDTAEEAENAPEPLLVSKAVLDKYTQGSFLRFSLAAADRVEQLVVRGPMSSTTSAPFFRVMEDVPGKPGLIADEVGALVVLGAHYKRASKGNLEVHIGMLRSYEGMGVVRVSLTAAPGDSCTADLEATAKPVLKHFKELDCLWPERVSVKDTLSIEVPPGKDLPKEGCLFLKFEVPDANRAANKVKLLDFSLTL